MPRAPHRAVQAAARCCRPCELAAADRRVAAKLRRSARRALVEPSMTNSRGRRGSSPRRLRVSITPAGRQLLANARRLHWRSGGATTIRWRRSKALPRIALWCSHPVRGSRAVARGRACRRTMLAKPTRKVFRNDPLSHRDDMRFAD
jgi:hypothetical protein